MSVTEAVERLAKVEKDLGTFNQETKLATYKHQWIAELVRDVKEVRHELFNNGLTADTLHPAKAA